MQKIAALWRRIVKRFKKSKKEPYLRYIPEGWQVLLDSKGPLSHNDYQQLVDLEVSRWKAFCENLRGTGPLGFSHEHSDMHMINNPSFHNIHMTYGYVLALTAHKKSAISILDWGGSLGHYYLLAKALMPDIKFDFHCREVPLMVEAGKKLNPEIKWYSDDSCLEGSYDLVIVSGSLQYIREWRILLQKLAQATGLYFLLTQIPVVNNTNGFVAVQNLYGYRLLHQQFNERELLAVMDKTGLRLMRELVIGYRPYIDKAPEQCEIKGWLFKR